MRRSRMGLWRKGGRIGSWIEGQWVLWGDGRSLASKTQRLIAFPVLETCDDAKLSPTWGMASLLVELADEVLGSVEFDEVLRGSACVEGHREGLVEALRAYEAVLARAGLVDPGRACALLSVQKSLQTRATKRASTVSNQALRRSGCSRHSSANRLRTDGSRRLSIALKRACPFDSLFPRVVMRSRFSWRTPSRALLAMDACL